MSPLLPLLIACAPPDGPPADSREDTGPPVDSGEPTDSGDTEQPVDSADTADTADTVDTAEPLPYGDNLVQLGAYTPFSNMEALGLLALDGDLLMMCAGVASPSVFDVSDPSFPLLLAAMRFPAPATGPRCQHLAALGGARVAVTHHGDEMGDAWLGVADLSDPLLPLGVVAWARTGVELEGIDTVGDAAWVAAHAEGIFRFDLAADDIPEPTAFDIGGRNAYAVRARGDHVAVGTVEGTVVLLDGEGGLIGEVEVSGPVRDLGGGDDDTLYAACGSSGLDRIDVESHVP
jgi:hypothetical protein